MSKQATKKSTRARTGSRVESEDTIEKDFTERMLLSMMFDISQIADNVERVKVQVFTMARAHRIVPPADMD